MDLPELPSSDSLLGKTEGFLPEALSYLEQAFSRRIERIKDPACAEMLTLLKQRATESQIDAAVRGDPWAGEPVQKGRVFAWQETQQKEIDNALKALVDAGVQTLHVDIAISSETGNVLTAYKTAQGGLDENLAAAASRLLNGCFGVADAEGKMPIVCQDSTLYQADSTGKLKGDASGQPLVAQRAQITSSFEKLKEMLAGKGIKVEIEEHDYEKVMAESAAEEPVSEEEVVAAEEAAPGQVSLEEEKKPSELVKEEAKTKPKLE